MRPMGYLSERGEFHADIHSAVRSCSVGTRAAASDQPRETNRVTFLRRLQSLVRGRANGWSWPSALVTHAELAGTLQAAMCRGRMVGANCMLYGRIGLRRG